MKKVFVAVGLLLTTACGSGANSAKNSDSTADAGAGGNSDGINTIGADTAHIDTSLSKIKSDSAR